MRANDVLRIALREADLLAHSGAPLDDIAPIIRLAQEAYLAGDGEIPDERVREVEMQDGELSGLLDSAREEGALDDRFAEDRNWILPLPDGRTITGYEVWNEAGGELRLFVLDGEHVLMYDDSDARFTHITEPTNELRFLIESDEGYADAIRALGRLAGGSDAS